MRRATLILISMLALTFAPIALATNYDEGVNGDLSGNRNVPTSIPTLTAGSNQVTATSVSGDREYWTVTVPAGHTLSSLTVASYVSLDQIAFIGVQSGTTFTEPPTGTNVANILGYAHFGPGNSTVGTDILDNIGTGGGAIGFTPPLPAGNYTFWSQQTGGNATTYALDLQVVALVPALSRSAIMLLIAAIGIVSFALHRRLFA